ncbi:LCP family protein [Evansella tamaricis]|uniref:LCP family protein n=1 Tax=Evansella tamaricis TaxID=2069301 RepID=A0ABS6JIN1_9BACI|nr:LCP family protein [Evansella tamaricis]MBU9713517.1 LCP family protein [Evansella tamaricis]
MRQKRQQKKTKKKMKPIYRVLLLTVIVLSFAGITYAGFVGVKVYQTMNKIQDTDFVEETEETDYEIEDLDLTANKVEIEERVRNGNTVSVMIAGIDNVHGRMSGRSDVLMVAVVDLDTNESSLVSIPRDTYVEIYGTGEYDKINHAFADSVNTSVKTVENYLDIPIDHYVAINFTGFEQFIDFMGGIQLEVERSIFHNLHPDRVYLYPGVQTVNGKNALEYVRFRADNEGDFGRNRRQQQVIKEVLNQSTNLRTVTRIPDVLDILGDNVRTSMDMNTMFSMARNLNSLTGDNVESLRLVGDGMMKDGIYYVEVAKEDHQEVVAALHERMQIEYVTVKVNEDELVEKALNDY